MKYQNKFIFTTTIITAIFIQGCQTNANSPNNTSAVDTQNSVQVSDDKAGNSVKKDTIEYKLPMQYPYEEFDPNKNYGPSNNTPLTNK